VASTEGGCCAGKTATAGSCSGDKSACTGGCGSAKLACDKSKFAGQVQAVFTSLPSVKYRVGDQTVACGESAKKMAADAGKPIQYVVGDQVFENRHDAMARLAGLLEAEAEAMQSVQYSVGGECSRCPMTAKSMADKANKPIRYRVAGVDFADKDMAEKAVQLVKDAAAGVKLSYKVGEKSFCCDKMAGAEAKKVSAPVHYVVGESEVADDAEAQVVLVNERIRTMVEAAASLMS
jgi:enamine deaminase RidA (YjgF/YER057c/UK114 family)